MTFYETLAVHEQYEAAHQHRLMRLWSTKPPLPIDMPTDCDEIVINLQESSALRYARSRDYRDVVHEHVTPEGGEATINPIPWAKG